MSESDEKTETEGKGEDKRKLPRREWLAGFAAGGVVTAGAALGYESCQVKPRVAYAPDLELSYVKSAIGPLQTTDFVSEGQRRGLLETGIQKGLADDIKGAEVRSGTPAYMAPEQLAGKEVTVRSDVYALGATLYEALVGEPPFTGPTAQAIIARLVTEDPRPLVSQRKTVPAHVEAAVLTAIDEIKSSHGRPTLDELATTSRSTSWLRQASMITWVP